MKSYSVRDFHVSDESYNERVFVPLEDCPDGTFEKSDDEKKAEAEMFEEGDFYSEI